MLDSLKTIAGIIASVFAIVASMIAIIVFVKRRQYAAPRLKLVFAPFRNVREIPRRLRRSQPSIICWISDQRVRHPFLAHFIYGIDNPSSDAVKDVRITLEYSSSYLIENKLLASIAKLEPAVVGPVEAGAETVAVVRRSLDDVRITDVLKERTVVVIGGRAQVSFHIPLVRPGERLLLHDMLLFDKRRIEGVTTLGFGDAGFERIISRMREVGSLKNYLVMNVFVHAENASRVNAKVSVLRLTATTPPNETVNAFGTALWLGRFPAPGWYWSDIIGNWILRKLGHIGSYGQKLWREELGVMIFPRVANIRTPPGREFSLEVPDMGEMQWFSLKTPNCDYFELPAHVSTHGELVEWLGFGRGLVFWPLITVRRLWAKARSRVNPRASPQRRRHGAGKAGSEAEVRPAGARGAA